MKRIGLANLEAGMVLGQDISRSNGAVLVKLGTELNANTVSMIQRLAEIETVVIEGAGFGSPEERKEWQKDQLRALIQRFSKAGNDPITKKLRKLETDRIMSVN